MSLLGAVLYWALTVYFYVLLIRFFLDLVIGINRSFRPKGLILVLSEITFTLTDPPLNFLRRFIKPIRVGSLALDFGWTILLILVSFLRGLAFNLM